MAQTKYYVDINGIDQGGYSEGNPNILDEWAEVPTPPHRGGEQWDSINSIWKAPDAVLKEHLANYRWQKEIGGIVWSGVPIRTDDRSKMLLSGIQQKIEKEADPAKTRSVKTVIGFQTLTNAQLESLYDSVTVHVQKCFDAEELTLVKIDDNTLQTLEEVETEFDAQYDAL